MKPVVRNLFSEAASPTGEEVIQPLLDGKSFRLESIHSFGQPTPKGSWYDQDTEEWVLLVQGSAVLEFEGEGMLDLKSGDFLLIPAHCMHRVESTSGDAVWLALHTSSQLHLDP
jgi:cupin 2 domain-containing protein